MENNEKNRLITPWGYIGYGILFAIPVVGLIFTIVFAFSKKYPCRRNYARSVLIALLVTIIIGVVLYFCGFNYATWFERYKEFYQQSVTF